MNQPWNGAGDISRVLLCEHERIGGLLACTKLRNVLSAVRALPVCRRLKFHLSQRTSHWLGSYWCRWVCVLSTLVDGTRNLHTQGIQQIIQYISSFHQENGRTPISPHEQRAVALAEFVHVFLSNFWSQYLDKQIHKLNNDVCRVLENEDLNAYFFVN